jgi:hypothetical protein
MRMKIRQWSTAAALVTSAASVEFESKAIGLVILIQTMPMPSLRAIADLGR